MDQATVRVLANWGQGLLVVNVGDVSRWSATAIDWDWSTTFVESTGHENNLVWVVAFGCTGLSVDLLQIASFHRAENRMVVIGLNGIG